MTPQRLRELSNVAHTLEGSLIAVIGVLTLIEAMRGVPDGRMRFAWPALTVGASVLLPGFVIAVSDESGWEAAAPLWRDPQQRQHLYMAAALFVAGTIELWRRAMHEGRGWWTWPVMLLVLAALLATHTEYGTPEAVRWAERQHVYQGLVVAAAGVCFAAVRAWSRRWRAIEVTGPLILLVGAALLVSYREPPGAYERQGTYSTRP